MLRFFGKAHNAVVKFLGLAALSVFLLWAMCRNPINNTPNSPLSTPTELEVVDVLEKVETAGPVVRTFIPALTVAATSTPTATQPAFLARCLDVPKDKIDGIATGLTVSGGGSLDSATAQAVKSNDYVNVYFIAAAIHGLSMGDNGQIGVWASNSLSLADGIIYAVGGMATEFSDWGDGGKTDFQLSLADDGFRDAVTCVEHKQRQ
jgi:hypothetical protein